MNIFNRQSTIFLQNLTKSYTEGVYSDTPANRKLGRVGMSYKQYTQKDKKDFVALYDDIYDAIADLSKKRFKDSDWSGVKEIKDKIGEVVEKYQKKYEGLNLFVSVENGGYKENDGAKWKEYQVSIEQGDNVIIEGVINCHAAGPVNDPFSVYDCSIMLDLPNISDEEKEKFRGHNSPKIALSDISVDGENKYKFITGKKPSGVGNWMFQLGSKKDNIFSFEGSYQEAKAKAKKEAQKKGDIYRITLLP